MTQGYRVSLYQGQRLVRRLYAPTLVRAQAAVDRARRDDFHRPDRAELSVADGETWRVLQDVALTPLTLVRARA